MAGGCRKKWPFTANPNGGNGEKDKKKKKILKVGHLSKYFSMWVKFFIFFCYWVEKKKISVFDNRRSLV